MARTRASQKRKAAHRPKGRKVGKKNGPAKRQKNNAKPLGGQLDLVSQEFDAAVDTLREKLEVVGGCLHELLAAEAGRECRRRFTRLAKEGGVLHSLQALAAKLERIPPESLPQSLDGVEQYARLAVAEIAREFDVQATHQPDEEIIVTEDQQLEFDWTANTLGDRVFPLRVKVLRCGWKCGCEVVVKPTLTRAGS